ncbi:orotidine 5'-phosphate decarboxylase [bacterium B17]|nr:orotidine 5'-phosphate decarboxylase [bacterium B17]
MKPELIVALDVPESSLIPGIVNSLPNEISFYKVGLELFTSEGPKALEFLKNNNKQIFLDLKLHDIPKTVENAVKTAAKHGVSLLTVHAMGGRNMLQAAANAAAECEKPPKIVAVTTLTSLDETDFSDLGINRKISEQAQMLGGIAISSGIDGLVTSVHEVEMLRNTFGDQAILVTPGIRPSGGEVADQKRVATPEMAVNKGSSHLVVGRPILQAADPNAAALQILEEMNAAYSGE